MSKALNALEKVQQSIEAKIIEQLARDVHESMRGPVEAGKVLFRKPCITCKGLPEEYKSRHGKSCEHCNGTGFEPFEEYDQLAPVVKEGRIIAATWLFDHYILQRRIPKA